MKLSRKFGQPPRIEMMPLIDIVFLLLVFFIYAMLAMAVHHGLPVELPGSSRAAAENRKELSVTVQNSGPESGAGIFLDEEAVTLTELSDLLREKAENYRTERGEGPGVLLFADKTVDYQTLFAVLDRISAAGLQRVSLQAEKDEGR